MNKPFAVTSPFSRSEPSGPARLQRTRGAARIAFKLENGATRLDRLFQSGAAKIRLPHVAAGAPPQAVLINSAGGLTGGDRMSVAVDLAAGTRALLTTQACEKVYRSSAGEAEVITKISVEDRARLDWLPQETILFNGGRLKRRIEAELAPGATMLIVEATIFGRSAHGESITAGLFADRWRIRRQGRLIFADDLRFDWADPGLLRRPAVLGGGQAMASVLLVSEEAERDLGRVRRVVEGQGGASAWNGKLLARIVTKSGAALRRVLAPIIGELLDGAAFPRLWLT